MHSLATLISTASQEDCRGHVLLRVQDWMSGCVSLLTESPIYEMFFWDAGWLGGGMDSTLKVRVTIFSYFL